MHKPVSMPTPVDQRDLEIEPGLKKGESQISLMISCKRLHMIVDCFHPKGRKMVSRSIHRRTIAMKESGGDALVTDALVGKS